MQYCTAVPHSGSETHFKVIVVSSQFQDIPLLQVCSHELGSWGRLYALLIQTAAPSNHEMRYTCTHPCVKLYM